MYTHTGLSGCEEVENCISELVQPCNFPQPRHTILVHEFYLTTTQILEFTLTQCLPTCLPHGFVCLRSSEDLANILDFGRLNIHLRGPSYDEIGNRTLQHPTTSQHHVLA